LAVEGAVKRTLNRENQRRAELGRTGGSCSYATAEGFDRRSAADSDALRVVNAFIGEGDEFDGQARSAPASPTSGTHRRRPYLRGGTES
jgi:hypothetical protein